MTQVTIFNTEKRSNGDARRRAVRRRREATRVTGSNGYPNLVVFDRFVYPFESGHAGRLAPQAGPSNRSPPRVSVTPFLRVKTVTSVVSARSRQTSRGLRDTNLKNAP